MDLATEITLCMYVRMHACVKNTHLVLTEEPEHPKLVPFSFILSFRLGCFAVLPYKISFI